MAEYVKVGPWVNAGAPALSAANMDTLETQYELIKSEDLTFAGLKTFSGTVLVAGDIQHDGDVDTKFAFTADAISIETGGTSRLDLSNTGVRLGAANARVTTILDEDAMGSNSATSLCTQQSIKAYVDNEMPTYVEARVLTSTAAGLAAWINWDLSGSIPAGARWAEIHVARAGSTGLLGVRKNGSALSRYHSDIVPVGSPVSFVVELDAGRIVEYYYSGAGTARAFLMGYWT